MSFTLNCNGESSAVQQSSGPHASTPASRLLAPDASPFYRSSATLFPVPARVLRDTILALLDDPAQVEVETGGVVVARTATGLTMTSDSGSVEVPYNEVAALVASCP